MGCDIHLHAEVKIDGTWHHYAEYNCPRNYAVFARMANVRNKDGEIDPISEPRGLPKDISFLTKFSAKSLSDYHSFSWLSAEEITILSEFIKDQTKNFPNPYRYPEPEYWGYLFGNSWANFEPSQSIEDIRFVFWFDN